MRRAIEADVRLQFGTDYRTRNLVEFVTPSRPMVGFFIERTQMRQFMDQSVKAVMEGIAPNEDRPAFAVDYTADLPAVEALNHRLAHQIDFPTGGHRLRPYALPSLPRQCGNVLLPERSLGSRHLTGSGS